MGPGGVGPGLAPDTYRLSSDPRPRHRNKDAPSFLSPRGRVRTFLPTFADLPAGGHRQRACREVALPGLIAEGLSAPTVNKLRWKGEAVYKRAQRVWGIAHSLERVPHRPSGEFSILSPEEIAVLVRNAADEQDAALYATAAYAGLRLGELRGLIWADLDFADRLIHVRRSFVRGQLQDPEIGKGPLGADGRPGDPAPGPACPPAPYFTAPDDLVLVNGRGGAVEESALRRRFWKALDRAGLRRLRIHDLRHSYGSLAVRRLPAR